MILQVSTCVNEIKWFQRTRLQENLFHSHMQTLVVSLPQFSLLLVHVSVISSMCHLSTSNIKALTMIFHHISTYQRCCRCYWQYLHLHCTRSTGLNICYLSVILYCSRDCLTTAEARCNSLSYICYIIAASIQDKDLILTKQSLILMQISVL